MSGINEIDFMVMGTMHLLSVAAASSFSAPAADTLRRPTLLCVCVCIQVSAVDARKITQRGKVKWSP